MHIAVQVLHYVNLVAYVALGAVTIVFWRRRRDRATRWAAIAFGSLGFLELLFTPAAMVIAQTILATPIIAALVHRAGERAWARYGDELICDGASRLQAIPPILAIIRAELLTAVLAGFGRTISEVGAVILVGGNIRGLTRTMTTAITLQTSQGDLPLALALGAVLIGISISVSATVFALAGPARTAGSDEI